MRDSDGTLIFVLNEFSKEIGGTSLTIQEAHITKKPYLIIDLSKAYSQNEYMQWIEENKIQILNIAGPRESQSPGIYQQVFRLLSSVGWISAY